jgi:hypothetical protein
MNYIKVKGHNGLVRDISSGAIINTNIDEYNRYLKQKNSFQKKEQLLQQNTEEINNIKNEISEIKSMLMQLLIKIEK